MAGNPSGGKGASEIYEKIEANSENSFSMSVNQDFEDLFDMDVDLNGTEKLVKGDFERGKFLVVDKTEVSEMDLIAEFKSRGYVFKKIEDEDDASAYHREEGEKDNDELYVFTDKKGNDLKEVHFMILGEEKLILLSVYGDIHLEKK